MKIFDVVTPKTIVDLNVLESNIRETTELSKRNNKQLWPMVKTHKSTYIAKLQYDHGVTGFMTGTVDEAERLINSGFKSIMLAYPIAGEENIERVIKMAKKANIILCLDGIEAGRQISCILDKHKMNMNYLMVIDSGLRRFGVIPENAVQLASDLSVFNNLNLIGISTHPGHVYKATDINEVSLAAKDEINGLTFAKRSLVENGFVVDIVATGSTPTFKYVLDSQDINVLRPGNYVFYDNIQVSLGIVGEDSCALSVLATILARHGDYFLIDAGSKCLGLDKGAHGNSLIQGYGRVVGHPQLLIEGLSEEVGKIKILSSTSLKVGDKIQIIPNHSCSAANMTSYLLGYRNDEFERVINIDMRGNSLPVNINTCL